MSTKEMKMLKYTVSDPLGTDSVEALNIHVHLVELMEQH